MKMSAIVPTCHACGCAWPHPFLFDTLADLEAGIRGRCPTCSFFGERQQRLPLEAA
jgi:hypothetical protein